jgi:hypothetical protein
MADPCSAVVDGLIEAGAPVIFFDTCALLDVIRAPLRESFSVPDGHAVIRVLERLETKPATLSVVVDEQVMIEFCEHLPKVENEVRREFERVTKDIRSKLERIRALDSQVSAMDLDFTVLGFPDFASGLLNRVLLCARIVEDHESEMIKACKRMNAALAPSSRGKDSAKDCIITETFLRLARDLRERGFDRQLVFFSSNSTDYCKEGRYLADPLREEFNTVGAMFVGRWVEARYAIG